MANDFTPTSSWNFTQNKGFSLGMECKFEEAGTPAVVDRVAGIPYSITGLRIFGGSAKLMPKKPSQSLQFGGLEWNFSVTEGLFRVAILGDPAGGDQGMGPGSVMIINHIVSTTGLTAETIVIPHTWIDLGSGALPVPPDGSAYQMKCEFQATSDGGWPVSMELQLCGQYTL